jgi:hypothetical protein
VPDSAAACGAEKPAEKATEGAIEGLTDKSKEGKLSVVTRDSTEGILEALAEQVDDPAKRERLHRVAGIVAPAVTRVSEAAAAGAAMGFERRLSGMAVLSAVGFVVGVLVTAALGAVRARAPGRRRDAVRREREAQRQAAGRR